MFSSTWISLNHYKQILMIKNIFTKEVTDILIGRINNLTPATQPQWGKMNVAQMLAHCNVAYEMVFEPGTNTAFSGNDGGISLPRQSLSYIPPDRFEVFVRCHSK